MLFYICARREFKMWKLFSQNENDPTIYLKVETFDDVSESRENQLRYKITVTNYIKMWCVVYNNESMIQLMLESNKGTETEDKQEFLDIGLQMLHDPKMLNKKDFMETQNGNLIVRLLCRTPIVMKMNFTLILCSPEQFYQSITRPLLEVISDLQNSEKELRHHLIKKDEEIKGFMDMVPEGSPLMRCLRTKPYNDVKHMEVHSAVAKLFGTDPVAVVLEHIIRNGRPLPIQADQPGSGNQETLSNLKPSRETKHSPLCKSIKTTESSQLTLQLQIPAVKNEPNMYSENMFKNEPATGVILESKMSESKDVTNKSTGRDDGGENIASLYNDSKGLINNMCNGNIATENTNNTELNNHSKLQIDTDYTNTQSSEQIKESMNVSNTERKIDMKLEQTMSMKLKSSEDNSEQNPTSTPKKRRKNLNY